ncbi:MAG: peroxidase family protein, partial [Methyloligellaceae bacterium]
EGNLADPVSVADAEMLAAGIDGGGWSAVGTKFAFLLDIAHNAAPTFFDDDGDPMTPDVLNPDADDVVNSISPPNPPGSPYDNELLDAHFIAGDGRANENIALTAVHHVFHQEHNRLVEHTKVTLLAAANPEDLSTAGDPDGSQATLDLINGYLLTPLEAMQVTDLAALRAGNPTEQDFIDFANTLVWDGDRLFQAAKFGTEMQYQHLVFEEFARKVQPLVDIFASFEPSIDPSITMEFSQAVYRFGHSMLTENVDLLDADGNLTEVGLVQAFLNPIGFNQAVNADGTVDPLDVAMQDSALTAGALVRGLVRETGNQIDEHVTEALRNNLLGLPLDLASINIARGRDVGIPTLNEVRATFFEGTGDVKLKPYDSWVDFALHAKNELSIVNFIAAYGQHDFITSQTTLVNQRAAAFSIVTGTDAVFTDDPNTPGDESMQPATAPADRFDFLNSTGAWATDETGLNLIDLWIGGLAEAIEPFGGFLGSTFNFVFEEQLEDLQDGDRFYYLGRTAGLNFLTQLEQNSFAGMIARTTDIGESGHHLPGDIFASVNFILEVDQTKQFNESEGDLGTPPAVIGEAGSMDFSDPIPAGTIIRVDFTSPIANAVVALTLNSNNETDATVLRVVSIDANGFDFLIEEFDINATVGHGIETISWVAVEEGEHVLGDGTVVKAGFTTANQNIATGPVTFDTPFDAAPVVLAQVTGATADPVSTHIRGDGGAGTSVSTTGFQVALREQEANAQNTTADVGWIAIEQGTEAGSRSVGRTGDLVTHNPATGAIAYGVTVNNAVFLAHSQTQDGGDTFSTRGIAFDDTSANVFLQEETSANAETNHITEDVGFVAISSGQIFDAGGLIPHAADPTDGSIFFDLVIRDDPSTPGIVETNYLRYTGGDHVVLGGTDQADTLIGGIGDDTLWGDGGDDILEGGDGADILLAGDGDDIITDIGGEDNIQGQDGNDYIFAGGGEDLILGGAGKDFILAGPDLSETFAGLGDDFVHNGTESNIVFGGEGNDWLEAGSGNNLVQGDSGDPFLNSTVGGHDVMLSGLGDDDYDAEGGDDIMEGADGVQRFEGLNGFDWATYKDVDLGVNVDMLLRAFDDTPIPPSNASILDRFDSVQGLSGGRGSDILRGDDETRVEIENLNNGNNSVLSGDDRFELIHGLRSGDHMFVDNDTSGRYQTIFDGIGLDAVTEWGEGDIILGGAGSDLIEGRGGDDIIDGDLKLDVRLIVRNPDTGEAIATAFKMEGQL